MRAVVPPLSASGGSGRLSAVLLIRLLGMVIFSTTFTDEAGRFVNVDFDAACHATNLLASTMNG
jgi:hypothetical protein